MKRISQNGRLKKYRHMSVFTNFILSYAAFFFVPVIIAGILYGQIVGIMEDNANRSNVAMLEQLKQVVDVQLQEVDQLARDISLEPKLQPLLNDNKMSDPTNAYDFFDLFKDLKKYFMHNKIVINSIFDFYIYFKNSDVILTPSMKTSSEDFYRYIYQYQGADYNQWANNMLNGYHYNLFVPSSPVITGSGAKNIITCVRSLPLGEKTNIKGALVILIDEQQIKDILNKIEWSNQGQIYIVNEKNEVIMTTAQDATSYTGVLKQLSAQNGPFEYKIKGLDMMVSYTSSAQTGWKYVSMVSRDVFMSRVNSVRNTGILILILCLMIGMTAVFFMASRNYGPVKDVVNTIKGAQSNSFSQPTNEYDLIKRTILDKIEEEKNLSDIVHQQMPVVKANFLQRLIKGYTDDEAATVPMLEFMGVSFISNTFAVLIISIDDISRFTKDNSEKDWVFIRFVITNICNEVISEYHKGYITELERNRLAILLNFDARRLQEIGADIKRMTNRLNEEINSRYKISITIGVSDVHEEIGNIAACYTEASSALEYKMLKSDNAIIYFAETKTAEQNYFYPIDSEIQLINTVKAGELKKAEKILSEIFEVNFKAGHISPETGKCLFFDIMGTFIKILSSYSEKFSDIFKNETDPIKMLSDCRTVEEMHEKLRTICREICNYVTENHSNHSERMLSSMMDYIDRNYMDGRISLNSISEEFNITPQYLSLFFKKYKGQNIIEYITERRIAKAKQLLAGSPLSIAQIAQLIGYANDAGFIRVFRKTEGITPGKFREMNQTTIDKL